MHVSEPSPHDGDPSDHGSTDSAAVGDDQDPSSEQGVSSPIISPVQGTHRCTPALALEFVYEVLGRPVGIDPCGHEDSLVDARRVVMPPQSGLEVPWHELRTGFVSPPCGQDEEPRWIHKAIQEARLGWEGILLLPAKTGAPWFEPLYRHSPCMCFWGSPALEVEGRLWFDEDDPAMLHTQFVYLGPRYEAFARVFSRGGQLIYPRSDQALTVRIAGRTMPSVEHAGSAPLDEALEQADRRQRAGHLDSWVFAVGELPTGTKVDDLTPSLRTPIDECDVRDVAHGLLLLEHERSRTPLLAGRPGERTKARAPDSRQVNLPLYEDGRASHTGVERERFDQHVLETLKASAQPIGRADIISQNPCTEHEYRSAIKRLKKAALIEQVGQGKRALYRATQPPRTEQDDGTTKPPNNGNATRTPH